MGKPGAFLEHGRVAHSLRPVEERTRDFDELYQTVSEEETRVQASRCMACGVAFCQVGEAFGSARPSGCPLLALFRWNTTWRYQRGQWEQAAERWRSQPRARDSDRVCPALCEAACNLARNDEAETIHDNERAISDWQWEHGGPRRFEPAGEGAPSVAVVGSGPAGLVARVGPGASRGARVRGRTA